MQEIRIKLYQLDKEEILRINSIFENGDYNKNFRVASEIVFSCLFGFSNEFSKS